MKTIAFKNLHTYIWITSNNRRVIIHKFRIEISFHKNIGYILNTNEQFESRGPRLVEKPSHHIHTDLIELKALIELLEPTGVQIGLYYSVSKN